MMSRIPTNIGKMGREEIAKEILRIGMIAELDAINLYEQLSDMTERPEIKELFMDIAKEEKTHMGEFQTMLLRYDKQQVKELEEGKKEVEELTK